MTPFRTRNSARRSRGTPAPERPVPPASRVSRNSRASTAASTASSTASRIVAPADTPDGVLVDASMGEFDEGVPDTVSNASSPPDSVVVTPPNAPNEPNEPVYQVAPGTMLEATQKINHIQDVYCRMQDAHHGIQDAHHHIQDVHQTYDDAIRDALHGVVACIPPPDLNSAVRIDKLQVEFSNHEKAAEEKAQAQKTDLQKLTESINSLKTDLTKEIGELKADINKKLDDFKADTDRKYEAVLKDISMLKTNAFVAPYNARIRASNLHRMRGRNDRLEPLLSVKTGQLIPDFPDTVDKLLALGEDAANVLRRELTTSDAEESLRQLVGIPDEI